MATKKIRGERIVEGFANMVISKTDSFSKIRKDTCKACELRKGIVCGVCGCVIAAKTKVAEEYCPENKWFDIMINEKTGIAVLNLKPELVKLSLEDKQFVVSFIAPIKVKQEHKIELKIINDRASFFDSKVDLTDIDIRTTCGCTVVNKFPKTLKDGDSSLLTILFTPKEKGSSQKTVIFKAEETLQRIIIKANNII